MSTGLAVLVLTGLAWGMVHARQQTPADLVGRVAPALAIRSIQDGREIRLADLRGRPVALNFWASWCSHCWREAPVLNDSSRRYQGRVLFIGANIWDSEEPAGAFLAQLKVPYSAGPILSGSENDYRLTGVPETFFIDREGVIVGHVVGDLEARQLDVFIGLLRS
jgi:cytochrome c biogenesis protein CcmG/thiol:disulfide interchange protein DsbE